MGGRALSRRPDGTPEASLRRGKGTKTSDTAKLGLRASAVTRDEPWSWLAREPHFAGERPEFWPVIYDDGRRHPAHLPKSSRWKGTDFKCATGQFAAKKTLCHVSDLEVNDAGSHQSYSTGGWHGFAYTQFPCPLQEGDGPVMLRRGYDASRDMLGLVHASRMRPVGQAVAPCLSAYAARR